MHQNLLLQKIKFPLLEYAGKNLFEKISEKDRFSFCDEVERLKTMGGNVLLGIMLQLHIEQSFKESFSKAAEYISMADIWYVCDIIGERVFGYGLVSRPKDTFPEIVKLFGHESDWVVRALGAGVHYATKKGLSKQYVEQIFPFLLQKGKSRNKEIKQGIGWAAKTIAKFHPAVIKSFNSEIQDKEKVGQWFRTKVRIGLNRNAYAQGNRS
ncbi:MAG: DNA alkylation repair protein [Flavobacteriales bacterium]|nr:DNA alkylation repair protein [Flavobacteriales bacterium]